MCPKTFSVTDWNLILASNDKNFEACFTGPQLIHRAMNSLASEQRSTKIRLFIPEMFSVTINDE